MKAVTLTSAQKRELAKAMFFAKRELWKSLKDIVFSFALPFLTYFIILCSSDELGIGDIEIFPTEEVFNFLLKALIALCLIDFFGKAFQYRKIWRMRTEELNLSHCLCQQKNFSRRSLIAFDYRIEYVNEDCARIDITCPICQKAVFSFHLQEDGLFEFILK